MLGHYGVELVGLFRAWSTTGIIVIRHEFISELNRIENRYNLWHLKQKGDKESFWK